MCRTDADDPDNPEGRRTKRATSTSARSSASALACSSSRSSSTSSCGGCFGVYERGRLSEPQAQVYPLAAGQQEQLPPEPRLQEHPQQDMRELRAKQEAVSRDTGGSTADAGVARIPIEDAMRIVVERGLPAQGGSEMTQRDQ